ncbi:MAG: hypothetical protein AB4058_21695, partial [Microcystaceae cyanobacterium]
NGVYKLLSGEPVWLSQMNLGIGREIGIYQGVEREWLYWYDQQGKRYLTSAEKAIEAQERIKKLEAKLRSLEIDPDQ